MATPGTEACDAVGGALRPKWREWPSQTIRRLLPKRVAFGMLPAALYAGLPSCPPSARNHVALSVVGTERLSESGQLLPGENCSGETDQRIFNPILHRPRDICIAFVLGGGWHASVPRAAHKLLEECGYMGWWIDIHRWYINSAVVIAKALECARGRELAVTV
jgi:hypothetical protein